LAACEATRRGSAGNFQAPASLFAQCVVGAISFETYVRLSNRRDRITRAVIGRPQRARTARRAAARVAAKAGSDDGDPPDDPPEAEIVVLVSPEGETRVVVKVDGRVVTLGCDVPPRTKGDLAAAVDVARRAIRGDKSVRWLS